MRMLRETWHWRHRQMTKTPTSEPVKKSGAGLFGKQAICRFPGASRDPLVHPRLQVEQSQGPANQ